MTGGKVQPVVSPLPLGYVVDGEVAAVANNRTVPERLRPQGRVLRGGSESVTFGCASPAALAWGSSIARRRSPPVWFGSSLDKVTLTKAQPVVPAEILAYGSVADQTRS